MSERRTNVVQMIWITTHAKGSFYAAYFVVIFWVTGLVLLAWFYQTLVHTEGKWNWAEVRRRAQPGYCFVSHCKQNEFYTSNSSFNDYIVKQVGLYCETWKHLSDYKYNTIDWNSVFINTLVYIYNVVHMYIIYIYVLF